ncbi:AraC family transcriptional regulator [Pseudomonas sp. RIT-PI-AD]|uniref:AraC family transcriptional regulator n=1 Tax=Pseudomonas sp. RIT-PI-AD TaxID=3035294 RepID=UPI0021D7D9CC|nr:AraC family transcriptional regulator [Pseudomonas sp. RIT-PI-AD]
MDQATLPEERRLTTLHTVALAMDTLAARGVPYERLLADSGLARADLDTPDKLIRHTQELRVFANALECTRDPALGLSLGLGMHVSAQGILGHTLLASRTLRDALCLALARPALLGSSFHLALERHGDEARLVASRYRDAPALAVFTTELCLTALLTLVRDLLGEAVKPCRLLLPFAAPGHASLYAEKLGCPVVFEAPAAALCFDAALLERPLPLADPLTCHSGPRQCLELDARLSGKHDMLEQIRRHLDGHLRESSALHCVARRLHRSERTLRRHLQRLDTSYQRLLDEVRYDKARRLLADTDLPIYLIAEQLGYSETASFRHAFRRWSGQSPSLYRR